MCLVFIRKLETVKENCPSLLTETEEEMAEERGISRHQKYVRIITCDELMMLKAISLNSCKLTAGK